MKKGSLLRFIAVCAVCFAVLLYNISDTFKFTAVKTSAAAEDIRQQEEKNSEEKPHEQTQSSDQQTQKQETVSETESSTSESTESVAVSAEAIKGKIVENYISPYNAPQSYNKVYMKNTSGQNIDIKTLLNSELPFKITKNDSVQVLIMHTHTTETFMTENTDYYTDEYTSRSRDNNRNMVKIGEIITEKLNAAGIKTVHDKTQHDYPNYTGSSTRSAQTVNSYLEKYPDIKVVLDLHRDAVSGDNGDKIKLVTEINGKKAAQVMLVMGSQSGSSSDHPDWQENLKAAVKLQHILEDKYPTLARPLSLTTGYYNQGLTTGSMLIEFGTDANTLDEASYSAELVADALTELLG